MGGEDWQQHCEIEDEGLIRIKKHGDMLVDGMLVADSEVLKSTGDERSIQQLLNTASMPGIVGEAWAMADWHYGYGFPIGGVVATDCDWGEQGGAISPGGVGFDINCGVRTLSLELSVDDIPDLERLSRRLNGRIPAGASGKGGVDLSESQLEDIVMHGANAAIDLGFGHSDDLTNIESNGELPTAGDVSKRARQRGLKALGTLGTGNHFLELQAVEEVHAENLGLYEGQVMAMIHSGSRGFGHQVCTDHVRELEQKYKADNGRWTNTEWGFTLPDRQLAAAPIHSKEGQSYLDAMNAAANYAFANRSTLTQRLRDGLKAELGVDGEATLLYDVGHNLAKMETHTVHGKNCNCCVHRKGATRAFADQPVLVPGDMGTASWILSGKQGNRAFNSSCHGAGRILSRTKAKKQVDVNKLRKELLSKGIIVHANTDNSLAEEAPEAYKNVDDVIELTTAAGLAEKVARLRPLTVIKG